MDPFLKDTIERVFFDEVMPECAYAEREHGNLPSDPCRVNTILVEEVGEAAEEALDMTRDRNTDQQRKAARERYIREMTQVAAVAIRALAMEVTNER